MYQDHNLDQISLCLMIMILCKKIGDTEYVQDNTKQSNKGNLRQPFWFTSNYQCINGCFAILDIIIISPVWVYCSCYQISSLKYFYSGLTDIVIDRVTTFCPGDGTDVMTITYNFSHISNSVNAF